MTYPKPLEDYYIILADQIKEEHKGGLLVPDELKEKPLVGTIMAAGKGKQAPENGVWIEQQAKVKDRVLFKRLGNTKASVMIENVEHLMMRQCDILMIL